MGKRSKGRDAELGVILVLLSRLFSEILSQGLENERAASQHSSAAQ